MQEVQLFVGVCSDDCKGVRLLLGVWYQLAWNKVAREGHTIIFDTIPKTRKQHELAIFPLDVMRDLVFAIVFVQPFVKSMADDEASLPLLHVLPEPGRGSRQQRVVSAIDCTEDGIVIWISLRP